MSTKLKLLSKLDETFTNPNLLFQQLTAIEENSTVNLEQLSNYEFTRFLTALARSPTKIDFSDKPKHVKCLWKFASPKNTHINSEVQWILDGGNLIYKMGVEEKNEPSFSKLLTNVLIMLWIPSKSNNKRPSPC